MGRVEYVTRYEGIDFSKHPEKYVVGRGEQGVLIAEPYKSELLPHWRFKTPQEAEQSAKELYRRFKVYKEAEDFVGMDMARKFLQMGWTRSRRYANHMNGRKYDKSGVIRPQDPGSESSAKALSARVFYEYFTKARKDPYYMVRLADHREKYE